MLLTHGIMPYPKPDSSSYFGFRNEKVAWPTNSKRKLTEATADKQKITPVNNNKFRTTTRLVMQIEFKKWSYHCPGED